MNSQHRHARRLHVTSAVLSSINHDAYVPWVVHNAITQGGSIGLYSNARTLESASKAGLVDDLANHVNIQVNHDFPCANCP